MGVCIPHVAPVVTPTLADFEVRRELAHDVAVGVARGLVNQFDAVLVPAEHDTQRIICKSSCRTVHRHTMNTHVLRGLGKTRRQLQED